MMWICAAPSIPVVSKLSPSDDPGMHKIYFLVPPKDMCIIQYGLDESSKFTKQIGEKWTHSKDLCVHESCSYGPDGSSQVVSTLEQCVTDCAPGFSYQRVDTSKCCGQCVQSSCIFEQKLYDVNAHWKSSDNCTSYICLKKDQQLMVSSSQEVCPDVGSCLSHLLYQDGCCKRCKVEPLVEDKCRLLTNGSFNSLNFLNLNFSQLLARFTGRVANKPHYQGSQDRSWGVRERRTNQGVHRLPRRLLFWN